MSVELEFSDTNEFYARLRDHLEKKDPVRVVTAFKEGDELPDRFKKLVSDAQERRTRIIRIGVASVSGTAFVAAGSSTLTTLTIGLGGGASGGGALVGGAVTAGATWFGFPIWVPILASGFIVGAVVYALVRRKVIVTAQVRANGTWQFDFTVDHASPPGLAERKKDMKDELENLRTQLNGIKREFHSGACPGAEQRE